MGKLTKENLINITQHIDKGYGYRHIARIFGIANRTASDIMRKYKLHGLEGIIAREHKTYEPELKFEIIQRIYEGESITSIAIELNVSYSVIHSWIKKYEQLGYNGLTDNRGRPGVAKMGRPKKNETKTTIQQAPLTDPEREELNELRKRTKRLEMELELTKKLQALVQERIKRQTPKK